MKTLMLISLLTLSAFANQAFADGKSVEGGIGCSIYSNVGAGNGQIGLEEKLYGDCGDYIFSIKGFGISAHISSEVNGLAIQCPGKDNMEGTYYGVNASANIGAGVKLGLFASDDGFCIMIGGAMASIGANLDGSKLTITKKY